MKVKHYEGRNYNKVLSRLRAGWTPEQAFGLAEPPVRKFHNARAIKVQNRSFTSLSEVAKTYSVPLNLLHKRLKLGWTTEEAVGLIERTREASNSAKPVVVGGKVFRVLKLHVRNTGL